MGYKMKMSKLASLYYSMKDVGVDMCRFEFTYARVDFEAIYVIFTESHRLLLGALNGYNFACIVRVEKGFWAEMDDTDFFALCNILHLRPGKEEFTSWKFLRCIDNHCPQHSDGRLVDPIYLVRHVVKQIPPDQEPEKDIFIGWNDHTKDGRTARNFKKTELYLGKNIADFCRTNNISSMWTSNSEGDRKQPSFPPGYAR